MLLLLQRENFSLLYRGGYFLKYFGVSLEVGVYAGKPPSSSPLLENPDRMVKSTCAKYHGKAVIKLLKKLNDNLPEDKLEQVRKYSVF